MKRSLALVLLLLLVSPAVAQEDDHGHDHDEDEMEFIENVHSTEPLFLHADGTLDADVGGASQECLAIDSQSGQQSAEFNVRLTDTLHHLEEQTVVVDLAFTPGSTPGNGFALDAVLESGAGYEWSRSTSYPAGASLNSPVSLAFSVANDEPSLEAFQLAVTLTPTPLAGPLAFVDVGIQCHNPESVVHSFDYAVLTPADDDGHGHDEEEGSVNTLFVILVSIGAAVVTVVAGILPLIGRALAPARLHLFLGITAGLLLSIALVDLIPEAVEGGGGDVAWTVALGVLVLFGVKHMAGETHSHAEHGEHPDHHAPDANDEHTDPHAGRFAAVAFGALLFHRIVDGLALPGAFAAGGGVGFAASSAILIHQFPDGLAAATVFLAAGWRRSKVLWAVLILALATPIGSLIGLAFAGIEGALPHLLALAAATFIFIALAELLPELKAKQYRTIVVLGFIIGYALTFGIELFAELFGGGVHSH